MKNLHSLNDTDREEYEKVWGRFNDIPPGWRETTEDDFAKSFRVWCLEGYDTRQFRDSPYKTESGHPLIDAQLFFFNSQEHFGMMLDYWAGKVRYFRFGCDHDYRGVSVQEARQRGILHHGGTYFVRECRKCGHIYGNCSSG